MWPKNADWCRESMGAYYTKELKFSPHYLLKVKERQFEFVIAVFSA